jgi:hypothetical protein
MQANPQTPSSRFKKAAEILLRRDRPDVSEVSLVKARLQSSGYAEQRSESDDG